MKALLNDPKRRWQGYVLIGVAAIAIAVLLQWKGTTWVRVANLAILFALLALGLNIVVGFAGLLDLGYIAFYAVGAYTYALLASPHFDLHWPWYVILPICALVAGAFGVLLGSPTLKLRGDYLAIVTLGFGEIIRIFMNNLDRPVNITNGPRGLDSIDPVEVLGINFGKATELTESITLTPPMKYYFLLLLILCVVLIVSHRLKDSRIGRAWEAIREDEIAAKAMGIDTTKMKLLAFGMGATFGGVAGGIFSAIQGFISPESFVLNESIMVLAMVVLGGMGNIWGVVVGALVLTFVPEVLRHYAGPVQEAVFKAVYLDPEVLRMLIFGIALVLVMLYRPAGLLPSEVRKRELAREEE
jgi:branched-chain amino acid transport system permease protein